MSSDGDLVLLDSDVARALRGWGLGCFVRAATDRSTRQTSRSLHEAPLWAACVGSLLVEHSANELGLDLGIAFDVAVPRLLADAELRDAVGAAAAMAGKRWIFAVAKLLRDLHV